MQGSFENPPIIIRSRAWQTLLGAMAVTLFWGAYGYSHPGPTQKLVYGATLAYFLLAAAGLAYVLLRPPRLEIWRDKVVWFRGGKVDEIPFRDVTKFVIVRKDAYRYHFGPYVGYVWTKASDRDGLSAFFKSGMHTEADGLLAGRWEISADKLAELLNEVRLAGVISP